jgi:hypothetical protein
LRICRIYWWCLALFFRLVPGTLPLICAWHFSIGLCLAPYQQQIP